MSAPEILLGNRLYTVMKRWIAVFVLLFCAAAGFSGSPQTPMQVWSNFVAAEGNRWSVHFSDRNTIVALYGVSASTASTADEAASGFLARNAQMMGVRDLSSALGF